MGFNGKRNWAGIPGFKKPQPVFESGPVATSADEINLIRRCIRDFSRTGPRFEYYDWLMKSDKAEKAKSLKVTVKAYEDGLAAHFDALPLDTSWSRLLGVPLLRTLIEQTGGGAKFHRLKTLILPYLKPALQIDYTKMTEVPAVGSSYFWGHPDLAPEAVWPTLSECSDTFDGLGELPQDFPCGFIGQIGWRDFKHTVCGQDLPNIGGLSVFAFTEVNRLGIMETVIRPWSPEGPLARTDPPEKLLSDPYGDGTNGPFESHTIVFREVLSLPDPTDGPFEVALPGFKWGDPDNDLYCALRDACGEHGHGIGGYLCGTSGGDPSPDVDWMRLIVMRINPDCGVIHFGIPAADLQPGKLGRVNYVWMDWDS